MPKIRECKNRPQYLFFRCPGCERTHFINRTWDFNEDFSNPTIHPSILVSGKRMPTDEECERILAGEVVSLPKKVCHSFIRDGFIQFLGDCTHALSGKTVKLPEVREEEEG